MLRVKQRYMITWRVALLMSSLVVLKLIAGAQTPGPSSSTTPEKGTNGSVEKTPLSDVERTELLKLIKNLQERVDKLEAAQAATANASPASVPVATSAPVETPSPESAPSPEAVETPPKQDDDGNKFDGKYTPNLGFKVVNTEYGDMNVSIYTYVRYLNQLGLDPTYTDAFGNTKNVQQRQDVQLLKLQIKFLGWILSPKMRYFLYAWTSNANQGQGAQVVLA